MTLHGIGARVYPLLTQLSDLSYLGHSGMTAMAISKSYTQSQSLREKQSFNNAMPTTLAEQYGEDFVKGGGDRGFRSWCA